MSDYLAARLYHRECLALVPAGGKIISYVPSGDCVIREKLNWALVGRVRGKDTAVLVTQTLLSTPLEEFQWLGRHIRRSREKSGPILISD